jgi:hypothetical protein
LKRSTDSIPRSPLPKSTMNVDFSAVEDIEDYQSVPPGRYPCKVAEVREGTTRDGDARWSFRLEVIGGEFAGRTAAWDGISFGERGMKRTKHVLGALGFDVTGQLSVEPQELVGHEAWAEIRPEERLDPLTGIRSIRPRVPFMGYGESLGSFVD